ncbi:ribonuclease H [Senna tora]|uniref:Ribonuclease H n=1 Tax=Senna tora TaxID=362788 RepID=A0A834TB24_9FABA|nr:ribonuclease H [Senna tora]
MASVGGESAGGASVGLSPEEEDILERNKKKIKNTQAGFSGPSRVRVSYEDIGRDSDPLEDSELQGVKERPRSYLESLKRSKSRNVADAHQGGLSEQEQADRENVEFREEPDDDDDSGICFETDPDGDEACVVISISDKEKSRLSEPFDHALIIKLLGRNIGYKVLEKKLYQLWSVQGILSIIDLTNDYFLVKFTCVEDYENALLNGPWVIFDHYLTVQPWRPGFDPSTDLIQRLAVWIRFPDLPFEFFDRKFLRCFGNRIGRTVKVDLTTTLQTRGREGCPNKEAEEEPQEMSRLNDAGNGHDTDKTRRQPQGEKFGPWMVVNKQRRVRASKGTDGETSKRGMHGRDMRISGGPSAEPGQSRFAVLATHDDGGGENWKEQTTRANNDKGKAKAVVSPSRSFGGYSNAGGGQAHMSSEANTRRYFNSNIVEPSSSLSGPPKAVDLVQPSTSPKGLSNISEVRLSAIKKFMRNENSMALGMPGELIPNGPILGTMDCDASQLQNPEPPDPGEDDLMEDSEEASDDDSDDASDEDNDDDSMVPSTFQREEDLRHIEMLVWNCRGAGNNHCMNALKLYMRNNRPSLVALLETRCNKNRAQTIFSRLGFSKWHVQESNGFAGGIWVAWSPDLGEVEVLESDFQFVHLRIKSSEGYWVCSVVYASPHEERRSLLWDKLFHFSNNLQEDWVVAGDFNDILSESDKKGGAPFNPRRCTIFANRIDRCNLMEVPSSGSRFTWKGPLGVNGERIFEKLDRALCSGGWRVLFPEAWVEVLTRIHSDHHPLLLHLYDDRRRKQERPFRFEIAWMRHRDFESFVASNWNNREQWNDNVRDFTAKIRKWNSETFGHIDSRKRHLMARIDGIQRVRRRNPFLDRLEVELQQQLREVLAQEELLWFQKSRGQWLAEGDRNTRYYHIKTIARRRKNKIAMLRVDGNWVQDEVQLVEHARRFFTNLYLEENFDRAELCTKYGRGASWSDGITAKSYDSALWRNVARLWPQITHNTRWCVGNGESMSFWKDVWGSFAEPLLTKAISVIDVNGLSRSVASYGSSEEGWKMDQLIPFLNEATRITLMNEMPPNPNRSSDSLCWGLHGDGRFSVRKAYHLLEDANLPRGNWKWIWKLNTTERVRVFMWQVIHQRLPTKDRCAAWSDHSLLCDWCANQVEDQLHVLRDCRHAVNLWNMLVPPSELANFYHCDFRNWVELNLRLDLGMSSSLEWKQVWVTGMWLLWLWRNKALFDENFSRPYEPHCCVLEFVGNYNSAVDVFSTNRTPSLPRESLVAWEKPPDGWAKVNSDGAVRVIDGMFACGAIVRDHNGSWIVGMTRQLAPCSVLKAEAWGALEGLRLARDFGVKKVILESDSMNLVDSLLGRCLSGADVRSIVHEASLLLASFDGFKVQHRWREANNCADFLANLGLSCSGRVLLAAPPSEIKQLLFADVVGILLPRVVR